MTGDKNDGVTFAYSSNVVAEFAYDALGRRILKIDSIADETTVYYHNDRWQVVCEYDGGGSRGRVESGRG